MKTTKSIKAEDVQRNWWLVDLEGQVLGRTAARLASILRGKHRPQFTPHTDTGDFVVVVNAEKVALTGNKLDQKMYRHHSGYLGGLRELTAREMLIKKPEEIIRHAIQGMLPRGPLGRQMLRKLKVYAGATHPHEAQQPQPLPKD